LIRRSLMVLMAALIVYLSITTGNSPFFISFK